MYLQAKSIYVVCQLSGVHDTSLVARVALDGAVCNDQRYLYVFIYSWLCVAFERHSASCLIWRERENHVLSYFSAILC